MEFGPHESRPHRRLFLWKSPNVVRSHEASDRCLPMRRLQCQQSSTCSSALVNRTTWYPRHRHFAITLSRSPLPSEIDSQIHEYKSLIGMTCKVFSDSEICLQGHHATISAVCS